MPQAGVYTGIDADADIATHAAVADAHHAEVHGAAEHTNITREIFLSCGEAFAAAGALNNIGIEGGANADEPNAFFWMKVPVDFVSFTSVQAIWWADVAVGNMYWKLEAGYNACSEMIDTHVDVPALGATACGGAEIRNCQEPANPLTLAALALGDIIKIQFYRNGSNGLDTLDDTMYLEGLLFTYVANQ